MPLHPAPSRLHSTAGQSHVGRGDGPGVQHRGQRRGRRLPAPQRSALGPGARSPGLVAAPCAPPDPARRLRISGPPRAPAPPAPGAEPSARVPAGSRASRWCHGLGGGGAGGAAGPEPAASLLSAARVLPGCAPASGAFLRACRRATRSRRRSAHPSRCSARRGSLDTFLASSAAPIAAAPSADRWLAVGLRLLYARRLPPRDARPLLANVWGQ